MPPRSRGRASLTLAFAFGVLPLVNPGLSDAATETDVHAMLGGSVDLVYGGAFFSSVLREQGLSVADVTRSSQTTFVKARFGVGPGVEAFLKLPVQLGGSWNYSDVSGMNPCPEAGTSQAPDACLLGISDGTTVAIGRDSSGAPAWAPNALLSEDQIPNFDISGMGDMELGIRVAPLSEKRLGRSPARVGSLSPSATWIIDFALTVPLGDNFYETSSGDRGAASGAIGFRFGSAISKRIDNAEPYVSFNYLRRTPFDAFPSENVGEAVEIDPQDDLQVFTGVELSPYNDTAGGTRFGVDLSMGYHLKTKGTWTSGTLLPSVLDEGENASLDEVIQVDEQPGVLARVRLNFQAFNHLRVHAGTSLGYYLPTRVEHIYNVRYGRAIGVTYQFGISGVF